MTKLLKKLLILLMFSVITVSAQDVVEQSECAAKFSECLDKCADADEACMEACDLKYPCSEETEEES